MRGFWTMLLLLELLPVIVWGQGTAPSVVIYTSAKQGTDAEAAADHLANQISIQLLKQYPCVAQISDSDISILLDHSRQKQLLGGEDNGELAAVAGALGADNLISVKVTAVGGQISMNVTASNTSNGQMVTNMARMTGNGEEALDAAESLAQQFVNGLSSLKGRCDARWIGGIKWENRMETKNETHVDCAYAMSLTCNGIGSTNWTIEDVVEVALMPPASGSDGAFHPMGLFTHTYREQRSASNKDDGTMRCRPRGQNSFNTGFSRQLNDTYEARGQASWKKPLYVELGTSEYKIEYFKWPELTVETQTSSSDIWSGCEPRAPIQANSHGSMELPSGGYTMIHGKVDPKNPNTLEGQGTIGDQIKVSWHLRLVKPKPKR
jgi:hypothetical protein